MHLTARVLSCHAPAHTPNDKTTQQPQVHAQSLQGCDVNTETACKTSVLTHHSTWHLAQPRQCTHRKHNRRTGCGTAPSHHSSMHVSPLVKPLAIHPCQPASTSTRTQASTRTQPLMRIGACSSQTASQTASAMQELLPKTQDALHDQPTPPMPLCDLPGLKQASLTCSRELLQVCIAVIAFKCMDVLTVGRFCVAAAAAGTHCNRMRPATSSRCHKAMIYTQSAATC